MKPPWRFWVILISTILAIPKVMIDIHCTFDSQLSELRFRSDCKYLHTLYCPVKVTANRMQHTHCRKAPWGSERSTEASGPSSFSRCRSVSWCCRYCSCWPRLTGDKLSPPESPFTDSWLNHTAQQFINTNTHLEATTQQHFCHWTNSLASFCFCSTLAVWSSRHTNSFAHVTNTLKKY